MKFLFLFYTQAEAGAPGFLSRSGEEAAGNLAQTVHDFLSTSLGVELESGAELRAKSLNEDIRWRAFKSPESFPTALKAASSLFPEILCFAGENTRSVKTAEPVAQLCALPVCVDKRFDRGNDDKPRLGVLADAIETLVLELASWTENHPRCLLISTSQTALLEWTALHMSREKWDEFSEVFKKSTLEDKIPAVFACGYERKGESTQWIFE
jgi:hypothetical protein